MFSKVYIFLFTCVYNDRKHIKKLFESIKNQTANNFIYYLYDDGSNDLYNDLFNNLRQALTKKGIKSYYEKGEMNLGINKATEHCLKILRDNFKECTHFAWINSDDWLNLNYIKLITKSIKRNNNATLFIPNVTMIREDNTSYKYSNKVINKATSYLIDIEYGFVIYSHFAVNCKNYFNINPNAIIFDNKNFKNIYNDDCVLFLCSLFNLKSIYIKKSLSFFTKRNDSLSMISNSKIDSKSEIHLHYYEYANKIKQEYGDRFLKTKKIISTYNVCLYLLEKKEYKEISNYYKNNNKLRKKLNLSRKYIIPFPRVYLLYKFPYFYALSKKFSNKFLRKCRTKVNKYAK